MVGISGAALIMIIHDLSNTRMAIDMDIPGKWNLQYNFILHHLLMLLHQPWIFVS